MTDCGALSKKSGKPSIAAITDGTSNTMFMTEVSRGEPYIRGTKVPLSPPPLPSSVDPSQYIRAAWADQNGVPRLRGYTTAGSGSASTVAATGCNTINTTNHEAPYSFHTGGVQLLRADGSVTFMKDSSTANVVAAIITRAGGEVLNVE
ncbi:MAG: DUF1559 domain-containing protein, partial [Gemmataceae bacterium]